MDIYNELSEKSKRRTELLHMIVDNLRILHGTTKQLIKALKPKD